MYVVCKQGNDSQKAVQKLTDLFKNETANSRDPYYNSELLKKEIEEDMLKHNVVFKDIKGGITAWAQLIDTSLPQY